METNSSDQKDGQPQLVPAWMIAVAWDHLKRNGRVSQQDLVKTMRITRSAFVCALIARFPDVIVESSPRIGLRLEPASDEQPEQAALLTANSRAVTPGWEQLRRESTISPVLADTGSGADSGLPPRAQIASQSSPRGIDLDETRSGPPTYSQRLNHLFETNHPAERGPYTSGEVAQALQADGIPVHEASVTALRADAGVSPSRKITEALAYFFNVEAQYLWEAAEEDAARSARTQASPSKDEDGREDRSVNASVVRRKPPGTTDEPSATQTPVSKIKFTATDLLRLIGGLSAAARYAGEGVYADRRLLRRLFVQIAEAASYLQESLTDDVPVPVRFLEHVIVDWDETSPSDNGTERDYRWLAELLNRHLDS
ncbi:hypothetical protein [Mycolicibacterium arseniciresistens]|uniref:Uncharacterized protein n=1 Tax=Mycolicibacterium arseniciresistens TaxID=3062257 RepID=A0ABT8U9J6_9MYCO|nr:hypothetical protein [Mycolicibacterium arseniciresistens]MDO3634462.1 hypothetical protein [Mycolicibacterium arseniciresistens]